MIQFLLSNCFARQGGSLHLNWHWIPIPNVTDVSAQLCTPCSQEILHFKLPPKNQVLDEDCVTGESFHDTENTYIGGLQAFLLSSKTIQFQSSPTSISSMHN
ncbi:unnamed protein product [Larinioides sclopetarius]|uniref:Uncharacterized protein n=1 Tax=Larinioides sclopetarius TaxID=280406 RepID=A0AAV1Z615_9ARAC